MRAAATPRGAEVRPISGCTAAVAGLALLSAALLTTRVISAAHRDTVLFSVQVELMAVAAVGAGLAVGAAVAVPFSDRWAASLLGGALLLELLLALMEALRPLVVVPPLVVALALVLVPLLRREGQPGVDYSRAHTVVAVASVTLMVPILVLYQALRLAAPEYAAAVGLLIYLALLLGTVWLAVRKSWWAASGPVLALLVWFLGLGVGEHVLGWTA